MSFTPFDVKDFQQTGSLEGDPIPEPLRPPLPFRDALFRCIEENKFQIEAPEAVITGDAEHILHRLETYVVPSNVTSFLLLGAIWDPPTAASKTLDDYHLVFRALTPFYEKLLLAGGRYEFYT